MIVSFDRVATECLLRTYICDINVTHNDFLGNYPYTYGSQVQYHLAACLSNSTDPKSSINLSKSKFITQFYVL